MQELICFLFSNDHFETGWRAKESWEKLQNNNQAASSEAFAQQRQILNAWVVTIHVKHNGKLIQGALGRFKT